MKTLVTLIIFATLLTFTATAQEERTRHNPWQRISEKLDTDGDGQITLEEFSAGSQDRFDRMDTDGDGVLTEADMAGLRERKMRHRGRRRVPGGGMLKLADTSQDGTVDADEWAVFLAAVKADDSDNVDFDKLAALAPEDGSRHPRFRTPDGEQPSIPPFLDRNENGSFDVADLDAIFTELDTNEDGNLDDSELPQRHRPQHRRRGR